MPSNQRFEKSLECPTNESLLAFLQADRGELSAEEIQIVEHLGACEFCELTLEMLRAHPMQLASDSLPVPPIPEPLQQFFSTRGVHK